MGGPVERGRFVEGRCPCGVAVLGCPGVAGGVAADEPVDAPALPQDGDDEAAAVGVDQLAGPGPLGEVELQQFGGGDPVTLQVPGNCAPLGPGVADDRLTSAG